MSQEATREEAPERGGQGAPVQVDVRRRFRSFTLDVRFGATANRIVLFGPSGAGKSLTLRAIAGIFRPDACRIEIAGQVMEDTAAGVRLAPNKRRAGYVPQGYGLFPHMTVTQNVLYGLGAMSTAEREGKLKAMLELVGLAGLESQRPRRLSGGQQQRVALARALAVDPLVLLLDEPFAAIDAPLRAGLRADLSRLQSASGTAMITVTHDLIDAFALGDWIVVIDEGSVLQQGTRDDVYTRPATRKVAELVGIRNILRGTVTGAGDGLTAIEWNGQTLFADGETRHTPGGAVEMCIRSTHVMIRREDDAEFPEKRNHLSGEIVDETLMTEARRLYVKLDSSPNRFDLEIDLPEYTYYRLRLDANKQIEMHVRPDRIHVLPAA